MQGKEHSTAGAASATALEVVGKQQINASSGIYGLAALPEEEFTRRVDALVKVNERVNVVLSRLMREGVHFAKPPGRENDKEAKPGLLKAGGEVLRKVFNLVAVPKIDALEYGDPRNHESPAIRIRIISFCHLGDANGPIVGVGLGAANTWETKYRYRLAVRSCPTCKAAAIMRSKKEAQGGPYKGTRPWWCNTYRGGCGAEFAYEDPAVAGQEVGRVTNEDAQDLENTLLKIAEKRANIDSTISATGSSDLLAQDVEDMEDDDDPKGEVVIQQRDRPAGNASAKPQAHRSSATVVDGATPDQLEQIQILIAERLGVTDSNKFGAAMREAFPNDWKSGWPPASVSEGGKALFLLRGMKQPKPLMTQDPTEDAAGFDRAWCLASILEHAASVSSITGREILDTAGGVAVLVSIERLTALGLKSPRALDELNDDELKALHLALAEESTNLAKSHGRKK